LFGMTFITKISIQIVIKCFSKPTRGILRDIFQYINAANRAIKPTGNLSVQMSKLEESGYVSIHKDFFSNKPRTRYNLTGKGKKEFIDYVNALDKVIRQYNDGE
jgi:DNA-binding PadR family transcriptional regulator